MFKRLLLAIGFCLFASGAFAQNTQCPTRPFGDSSAACANTAFVQQAVGGGTNTGVVVTPTPNTLNPALTINQVPAGSASADVFLNSLTLNIGALSDPGHNIYGFGPTCNVTSASFSGQLFCGYTSLNVSAIGTPNFPNDIYVGHFNLGIASANTTDADASIFTGNDNVQVTGTGWHYIVGREIDVTATHAIADTKNALRIAQSSADAFQGTLDDAAIELINQGGAVGWKIGLEFKDVISAGGNYILGKNWSVNANGFAQFGTNSLLPSSGVALLVHAATNVNLTVTNNSNTVDVAAINDALNTAAPMILASSTMKVQALAGTVGSTCNDTNGQLSTSTGLCTGQTIPTGVLTTATTGSSPATGALGETIATTGSAGISLPNGTVTNLASVSLTAGDWLCYGFISENYGINTVYTANNQGISTANNTIAAFPFGSSNSYAANTVSASTPFITSFVLMPITERPTTTTSYFLNAQVSHSAGTVTGQGYLECKRTD